MESKLSKVEFGKPHLQGVRRVQKYELHGVAFVKGYEKTVGFTFASHYWRNCILKMDDLYQSKEVYKFFSNLLEGYSERESGLRKHSFDSLCSEWTLTEGKVQEVLSRIEKAIGTDWKKAFKTILFVHEK